MGRRDRARDRRPKGQKSRLKFGLFHIYWPGIRTVDSAEDDVFGKNELPLPYNDLLFQTFKILCSYTQPVAPVDQLVTSKALWRWDESSNLGVVTRTRIFSRIYIYI